MSSSVYVIFFFSSRRRHTRWPRDWSSDVCSSDLRVHSMKDVAAPRKAIIHIQNTAPGPPKAIAVRSEERRVGKECRSRRSRERWKRKKKRAEIHRVRRRWVERAGGELRGRQVGV